MHQSIIDIFHISLIRNVESLFQNDSSCVNVMIQEESGHTRLCLAIDYCPVDGRSPTILGQQSRMDIERAILRHSPHHLRQHAESHHHLQVCIVRTKLFHKLRVLHLLRLQHGQAVCHSILLHLRRLHLRLMTTYGFVGLSHYSHHIIIILHQRFQCFHCKLRCSHKNYL